MLARVGSTHRFGLSKYLPHVLPCRMCSAAHGTRAAHAARDTHRCTPALRANTNCCECCPQLTHLDLSNNKVRARELPLRRSETHAVHTREALAAVLPLPASAPQPPPQLSLPPPCAPPCAPPLPASSAASSPRWPPLPPPLRPGSRCALALACRRHS